MKKFYFFSLIAAASLTAAAGEYVTPGTGVVYTPVMLASAEGSGVSDLGDGSFRFDNDITISESDSFSIGDATTFKLADGVCVTIKGKSDFRAPAEKRLTVTRASESDEPKGFYLQNDTPTPDVFTNVDFCYAQLRSFSDTGFEMEGCTFTECNGKLSNTAALALGKTGAEFKVTNCTFTDCTVPAIGTAANYFCALDISDCTFIHNNTSNTNKPQINITVGGENLVAIRNCKLDGGGLNMVGGIAVGNLVAFNATNRVVIENCDISEHRYGITAVGGPINMEIRDNTLLNNNHETNAMNGGSGISLSGYNYGLNAIISGNHIENSLWGVTLIQCADVNLGEVDNPASPGGNVFKDNGNGGKPYDLYNNGVNTVYAQLNTWSVDEQTAEEIEKVIFHKADNPALGEVIYMPAASTQGIEDLIIEGASAHRYYDLQGRPVDNPVSGLYIEISNGAARKVMK